MILPRVLFVDDDPFVLAALQRSLRTYRTEFTFEFVADARSAIESLQGADLLLTDLQMPTWSGVELLQAAASRHPDVVRIAVSGQSDPSRAEPISDHAHAFFLKPCEPHAVVERLRRILNARARFPRAGDRQRVTQLRGLPAVLPIWRELRAATEAAWASRRCAAIAHRDPSLEWSAFRLAAFAATNPTLDYLNARLNQLSPAQWQQVLAATTPLTTSPCPLSKAAEGEQDYDAITQSLALALAVPPQTAWLESAVDYLQSLWNLPSDTIRQSNRHHAGGPEHVLAVSAPT